jgi:hypothetical protein
MQALENVENPFLVLWFNADAIVFNPQAYRVVGSGTL